MSLPLAESYLGDMTRSAASFVWAIAGCLLLAPIQLAAQSVRRFDAFRFPGKDATCESGPATVEDVPSTNTVVVFVEGEETVDGRLVEAGFNSAGAPVWLKVRAYQLLESDSTTRSWRSIPHAYFIRFEADGKVQGFHVPGLIGPIERPIAASRGRPISIEVGARARRLAEWVWENRCGRLLGG